MQAEAFLDAVRNEVEYDLGDGHEEGNKWLGSRVKNLSSNWVIGESYDLFIGGGVRIVMRFVGRQW